MHGDYVLWQGMYLHLMQPSGRRRASVLWYLHQGVQLADLRNIWMGRAASCGMPPTHTRTLYPVTLSKVHASYAPTSTTYLL